MENVTEDTDAYRTLAAGGSGLRDARHASRHGHFGGTSTFNGFGEMRPSMKIDHIFVTPGFEVIEHGVLSDNWDGLWASDHLPVIAELRFK